MPGYFPQLTIEAVTASNALSFINSIGKILNGMCTRESLSYSFSANFEHINTYTDRLGGPNSVGDPTVTLPSSLYGKFQLLFQETRDNHRWLTDHCLGSLEGIHQNEIIEEVLGP